MGPPGVRGEECKSFNPGPFGKRGQDGPDGPPGVCVVIWRRVFITLFYNVNPGVTQLMHTNKI